MSDRFSKQIAITLAARQPQAEWARVLSGQKVGVASDTGTEAHWYHLHFELRTDTGQRVDPYGLKQKQGAYPDPSGTNGNGCGAEHYWVDCPPSAIPMMIKKVWTTDNSGIVKTSFVPGESIRYKALINNSASTSVTAVLEWRAIGPAQTLLWKGTRTISSGTSTRQISTIIPTDAAPGTYSFRVTATYTGLDSSGVGKFSVSQ